MKYQLVLQFAANSEDHFDRLIEIEDKLEESLSNMSEVDGHDFGSGEMNIFVLTDEPLKVFEEIKFILMADDDISDMKAAYRAIESENFVILWPKDLTDFSIA